MITAPVRDHTGRMKEKPSLNAAYGLKSVDDNRRLYADWADTYDEGFRAQMDYRLPETVADHFIAAGGVGPVLDIGAGTGLVGQALAPRAITPTHGTDFSPELLAVADKKGVYSSLFSGDLLAGLNVPDATYAGVTSAGTFTLGHLGPAPLPELLRVTRSGGLLVLSINAVHFHAAGFQAALDALAPGIDSLTLPEVAIYGKSTDSEHAGDTAFIATIRKR